MRFGGARLAALAVFATSFLAPSAAVVFGGLLGSFLTYLAWTVLVAASIAFLSGGGRGSISVADSAALGLTLVVGLTLLGVFLGFDARVFPSNPESFLTSLGIFLVQTLGVELGRSAAMSLTKNRAARMALGTLGGLFLGYTLPALASYISGAWRSPVALLESMLYSLTITVMHELGGLGSGVVFRLVVDGYRRFSPLVLTSSMPPALRSLVLSLAYYSVLLYAVSASGSLRGSSKAVFELSRARRALRLLPEALALSLALMFLLLAINRFVPLVVISGSMSPALNVGDVVIVHAVGPTDLKVGDVVAYVMEGRQVVVHRLVSITEEGFRTKGDANPEPDPFVVKPSQVLGRVVFTIPRVGLLAIALRGGLSPSVAAPVAIVGAVAASLLYVRWAKASRAVRRRPIGMWV